MSKRQKERKHDRKLVKISGSNYVNIPNLFFDRPRPRFIPMKIIVDTQRRVAEVELDESEYKKTKKAFGVRKRKI